MKATDELGFFVYSPISGNLGRAQMKAKERSHAIEGGIDPRYSGSFADILAQLITQSV